MRIINPDALDGPKQRELAEMVVWVADNFDAEYMRPDDPAVHGRLFTVVAAQADLLLRLSRDRFGNDTIIIVEVQYWSDEQSS